MITITLNQKQVDFLLDILTFSETVEKAAENTPKEEVEQMTDEIIMKLA